MMHTPNQRHTAAEHGSWPGDTPYPDEDTPLLGGADAHAEFYRREAQRLIGLAAVSPFDDAKRQFLRLAQQYETLAEHAARRATRGV
jgi:hypothetical protein